MGWKGRWLECAAHRMAREEPGLPGGQLRLHAGGVGAAQLLLLLRGRRAGAARQPGAHVELGRAAVSHGVQVRRGARRRRRVRAVCRCTGGHSWFSSYRYETVSMDSQIP